MELDARGGGDAQHNSGNNLARFPIWER